MNTHLRTLIFMSLIIATISSLYSHNGTESYTATHSFAPITNFSGALYNLCYEDWKSTMLEMWDNEQTTLAEKLHYIFEQIHTHPTNQKIVFYNYNLARALFDKPEIDGVEQFVKQFDVGWWHDLVDQFHIGCPCVYLACLGTLPRFAAIIEQIHKNPMDQDILFQNYNMARTIHGKPTINSLEQLEKQFDTQWWMAAINEFQIERQHALERNRDFNSRFSHTALFELLFFGLLAAILGFDYLLRPSHTIPVPTTAPATIAGIVTATINSNLVLYSNIERHAAAAAA